VPSSLSRQKQGKPIESVELKVIFRADRKTLLRIKTAVPEATWKEGKLEMSVKGEGQTKVLEETKSLSDRVRKAVEGKR
jgi:hypothetical protein